MNEFLLGWAVLATLAAIGGVGYAILFRRTANNYRKLYREVRGLASERERLRAEWSAAAQRAAARDKALAGLVRRQEAP